MHWNKSFVFKRGVVKNSGVVEGPASTALAYDINGNLTRSQDFNGNSTCYAFDLTRNLETVRVEGFAPAITSCPANLSTYTPAAGTGQRKIVTAWHATYRLPAAIDEPTAGRHSHTMRAATCSRAR